MLTVKEQFVINQLIIGLYLGSFDPVHNAHVDIIQKILKIYNFTKIIYIPTGLSPVGKKSKISNIDRLKMLENALQQHKCLSISDYELNLKDVCYSINTIQHFKKKYPHDKLRLIIGEDNFEALPKWYKYQEIVNLLNIIVLARSNGNRCGKMSPLKDLMISDIDLFNKSNSNKIHYFNDLKSNISSTMIRDNVRDNKSVKEYISAENYKYILDRNLYK